MPVETKTRITPIPPRLVGKEFHGAIDSPEWRQAEKVKAELQRFLKTLSEASDSAQIDIATLTAALNETEGSGVHPMLLMGA
jgi:cytochrome c556